MSVVDRLLALNHPDASDAADEIERLRAAGNALAALAVCATCDAYPISRHGGKPCPVDEAQAEWKAASGG